MARAEDTAPPVEPGIYIHHLAHGGELSLTELDGDYTLHVTKGGVHFTVVLSTYDVWAIRSMVGDVVLARINELGGEGAL